MTQDQRRGFRASVTSTAGERAQPGRAQPGRGPSKQRGRRYNGAVQMQYGAGGTAVSVSVSCRGVVGIEWYREGGSVRCADQDSWRSYSTLSRVYGVLMGRWEYFSVYETTYGIWVSEYSLQVFAVFVSCSSGGTCCLYQNSTGHLVPAGCET